MIFLKYIGDHKKDTILTRIGWRIIRLVQSGEFKQITHTECVLSGSNYKMCTIASASIRDGGVRIKENIALTKGNWRAFEVKHLQRESSENWFSFQEGEPYNMIGAIATKIPGLRWLALSLRGFFCNWACLRSCGILEAYKETPSQSTERLIRSFGAVEVTDSFFAD